MMIPLIAAIILIESSGNPKAQSTESTAAGLLGITIRTLEDINRFTGKNYKPEDRFNENLSLQMFKDYMDHYCNERTMGHTPTLEEYARVWNQGKRGMWNLQADLYWAKVSAKMKNGG